MNSGGNPPSYIYRLLSENYDPDDYDLDTDDKDSVVAKSIAKMDNLQFEKLAI